MEEMSDFCFVRKLLQFIYATFAQLDGELVYHKLFLMPFEKKNQSFETFFFIPTRSFWAFYFYSLLLPYVEQELSREPDNIYICFYY